MIRRNRQEACMQDHSVPVAVSCNRMREAQSIQEIVSDTLNRLIRNGEISDTAKAANISQRALHNYIRLEAMPRIDKLEKIARGAFGMAPWQLLIPGIDSDANYAELDRLVRNWLASSKKGRSYLAEVSDQVAINNPLTSPPPGVQHDVPNGLSNGGN